MLTYILSREQFSHTEWNLNQEVLTMITKNGDKPFCYLKEKEGGEILLDTQGI